MLQRLHIFKFSISSFGGVTFLGIWPYICRRYIFWEWFRNFLKFIFDRFQILINDSTQCIHRRIYLFTGFSNFSDYSVDLNKQFINSYYQIELVATLLKEHLNVFVFTRYTSKLTSCNIKTNPHLNNWEASYLFPRSFWIACKKKW